MSALILIPSGIIKVMERPSALHNNPTPTHSLFWWPSFFLSLLSPSSSLSRSFISFSNFSSNSSSYSCPLFSYHRAVIWTAVLYIRSIQYPILLAASLFVFHRFSDSASTISTIRKVLALVRMLPCCRLGKWCLESLGLKQKPRRKLQISSPFDFKEGPAVHFPGYSEDDISLMREKAIASTAIVEDEGGDLELFDNIDLSRREGARSRASSYSCGIGGRAIHHVRRISRGRLY